CCRRWISIAPPHERTGRATPSAGSTTSSTSSTRRCSAASTPRSPATRTAWGRSWPTSVRAPLIPTPPRCESSPTRRRWARCSPDEAPMGERLFAIGDIHGCADELKHLLDALPLGADDTIVFVGDYI